MRTTTLFSVLLLIQLSFGYYVDKDEPDPHPEIDQKFKKNNQNEVVEILPSSDVGLPEVEVQAHLEAVEVDGQAPVEESELDDETLSEGHVKAPAGEPKADAPGLLENDVQAPAKEPEMDVKALPEDVQAPEEKPEVYVEVLPEEHIEAHQEESHAEAEEYEETEEDLLNLDSIREDGVIVDIPGLGVVNGTAGITLPPRGRTMYSFYGVPYGQETSGNRRFLPSELAEPWVGVRDVTRGKPEDTCMSYGMFMGMKGSEDCLKLFIFTPHLPGKEGYHGKMPVLVWFHGGGFTMGDFNLYRGNRLIDQEDVIVVTVHYRLGVLGFMCTHTEGAPGNAGLTDQVLALEWVQKYISAFGGDPDRVVIAGESAGAASVSHLMLYDGAEGLFRGVIAESGSALEAWAFDNTPVESALGYGATIGCEYDEDHLDEFVECMREVPAETIVSKWGSYASQQMYNGALGYSGVTPVLQKVGKKQIITEKPIIKLREGRFHKVPIFYGANKHEGTFVIGTVYNGYIKPHDVENDKEFWQYDALYLILNVDNIDDVTGSYEVTLLDKYMDGVPPVNMSDGNPGFTDMLGVMFFKAGVDTTARMVSRYGGTAFVYSFEYEEGWSNYELLFGSGVPVYHGVSHSDELTYIFTLIPPLTRDNKSVSRKMVKMWTNFIRFLDPTADGNEEYGIPVLPPYSENSRPYMRIDLDLEVRSDYRESWRPCLGMDGTEHNCVYVPK